MRVNFTNLFFLWVVTAMALVSCKKDNSAPVTGDDRVAVVVNAGLNTRVHDDQWDENDAIGIAMLYDGGTEIVNNVYNYHYVTSANRGVFEPSSFNNTIYFPQDGADVTFRAYYPYYPNLGSDMLIPVTTANQAVLPDFDLLTAQHMQGFSKNDPDVHLRFYHRMSKVIFKLQDTEGNRFTTMEELDVKVKGMKTSGTYQLLYENWDIDPDSEADMEFLQREDPDETYGIVLPRPADPGVTFEFTTPQGDVYTATMSADLELQPGYQYTFYIDLKKTPVTVSADIEEWVDMPASYFDALQAYTVAGDSFGVSEGDRMNVYLEENGTYGPLGAFTYGADGRWYPDSPVYWNDIASNPAQLRASIVADPALNTTQMADILLADDLSVARNTGANFTFRHAGSKVTVRLRSDDFSTNELQTARISLPNYLVGAYEQNGELVPGTQRTSVDVDRTDPDNGIAIVQPQTVVAGDPILRVTLGGRTYDADSTANFVYQSGYAYLMIVTLNKTEASFSARVVDWIPDTLNMKAVTFGTALSGAEGILPTDVMNVYTGNDISRTLLSSYTWDGSKWNGSPPAYWEQLPDQVEFYASILRQARYNDTQLDDYLVADPVVQTASNGVALTLRHPASKVTVQLTSQDGTFDDTELEKMSLVLPDYVTGGTVQQGVYVQGTDQGDIDVAMGVGANSTSAIAIIDPQTVSIGKTVLNITSPTGRQYDVTSNATVHYRAGEALVLNVDMSKTAVTLSARAIDWMGADTINLTAAKLKVTGLLDNTSDFFLEKPIVIYRIDGNVLTRYDYSYVRPAGQTQYSWVGDPIYWDDLAGNTIDLTAVYYPYNDFIPTLISGQTSFPWNLPPDQQAESYLYYDILTSHLLLGPTPEYANFRFAHLVSAVKVNIVVNPDEFSPNELIGATVTLNGFILDGTVDLLTGNMNVSNTAVDLTPKTDMDGSQYSAYVMPQIIPNTRPVVTLELPNYPGEEFTGTLQQPLQFYAGRVSVINITLNKRAIELSATYEEWADGDTGETTIE